MLKKILFILMIIPTIVWAQTIDVGSRQKRRGVMLQREVVEVKQTQDTDVKEKNLSDEALAVEEGKVSEVLEEETPPPPTTITPEEIVALETDSKKSIRRGLKKQDRKDRENFIGVMNWQEKTMKVRELMLEGKSYKEAVKIAEEEVEIPLINVKKDEDMEKYIYEKGKFITNEK